MSAVTGDVGTSLGRASQLQLPNSYEIDLGRLKQERLERLQAAMVAHELPVALLFNPASVRYATGTAALTPWAGTAFARCCIVPASGSPVLFEYSKSIHVTGRLVDDVRPTLWSGDDFARALNDALREMGMAGERLAIDALDSGRLVSLVAQGVNFVDITPAMDDAREVKTIDEIAICKLNGAIGDAMLYEFESAIRPGIREYELLAVLVYSLYRHRGEGLSTRLVSSGRNTNPWMSEAQDKMVMPGDLVAVDTDAYGYEGYVIDVSRTFLCGRQPTSGQREAYRVAFEAVRTMSELLKPGLSYEEFARLVPRLPERFVEQRYSLMAHTVGLEDDDGPGIPYVEDVEEGNCDFPDRIIRAGMVLCLESYAGAVGEPYGVKLEDQVLVTESGCELLSTYPFDDCLLRQ